MKIIFVRHGESCNNLILNKLDGDQFQQNRDPDPLLSPQGDGQCIAIAKFFHKYKIWVDKYVCSSFTRAILTANYLYQYRENQAASFEIYTPLYEAKGCYKGSIPCKGLTKAQVLSINPNIKLPTDVNEDGWFHSDHCETIEESRLRAKQFVAYIRSALSNAKSAENEKPETWLMIIHNMFFDMVLHELYKVEINKQSEQRICLIRIAVYDGEYRHVHTKARGWCDNA